MINWPNTLAAMVDRSGRVLEPFVSFFQQFSRAPSPMLDIDVGASPFAYTTKEPGNVHISGGTVSAVELTRGVDTIQLAPDLLIPVSIGDVVTVTYTVLPTFKFLPNYSTRRNA